MMARILIVVLVGLALAACFVLAGARSMLLVATGLGLGLVLQGLGFGFAGPWRKALQHRDMAGVQAQILAIALAAALALPLIEASGGSLTGAIAPIGLTMILAAFLFGGAMQVAMGCGSGTLVNAGAGNAAGLVALPFFVIGSFIGSLHVVPLTALLSAPPVGLTDLMSLPQAMVLTLVGLAALALVAWRAGRPGQRLPSRKLFAAALLVAGLATANLLIAGQPWGVVYSLGLWGAKVVSVAGIDIASTGFWANPVHAARLENSLLTDVTTLSNIGLIAGAFIAMSWRRPTASQVGPYPWRGWIGIAVAGFVMGWSARIAFGCNIGALFSGIATGSPHGWAWLIAAFAGAWVGLRLRPLLGIGVAIPPETAKTVPSVQGAGA